MKSEGEMDVRRTWNSHPIRVVMQQVWDYLTDDSGLTFEDYSPRLDEDSRWYITYDSGTPVAAFWLRRLNGVTWEAHANVVPSLWGDKRGTSLCITALDLAFEDTEALKFVAHIPDSAPETQTMAIQIGFSREGINKKSFLRDGVLHDQVYFGMTRKET